MQRDWRTKLAPFFHPTIKSWIARRRSPTLRVGYMYLLRVLIGLLCFLCSLWLAIVITLVLLDTQWKSALLQHWYDDYYTNYKIYFIIGPQLAIFYCLWLRWQERKLIFGRFSVWLPKWLFRVVVLHCLVSKAFDINFLAKSSFSIDVIKRKFNLPVITLNKSLSENYISCYKLTAYGRHN